VKVASTRSQKRRSSPSLTPPDAEDVEQFALAWTVFAKRMKAIAWAMLDRRLPRWGRNGLAGGSFMHIDGIEATGFVEHMKLPHYVEFQSNLQGMRRRRDRHAATTTEREAALV
jgi:alpha-D-ribose 1-methylphosphonate 5-triphosphate synthase subunit PhnI